MNARTIISSAKSYGYRYAFNGMEKDDQVKGKGNSYDFGARLYDSRLGRWLSLDSKTSGYPALSPYNFVGNSPLMFIDPNGKEIIPVITRDPITNNITTIELNVTGKVVFKDQINRSNSRKQGIVDKINLNISETWNIKTNEDIPKEWQNEDGTQITFKVTPKFTLATDKTVIDNCDHVIYLVASLPIEKEVRNEKGEVIGVAGGTVNAIGGMQMYLVHPSSDYGHEIGHWIGLNHRSIIERILKTSNESEGTNVNIKNVITKMFGGTQDNVMDWFDAKGHVTPLQFYLAYKLSQRNLLNTGTNDFFTKDNWGEADNGSRQNEINGKATHEIIQGECGE